MTGTFERNAKGQPLLNFDSKGYFTDDNGKQVNKHGRYVDEEGNIIDKYGRKTLDKAQLQDEDLPQLLNYEG